MAKLAVSVPTSRWLTAATWCLWTYSMGSSIVKMWQGRVALMRSTIEASVVDLPEPVGPVTRTKPWESWVNAWTTGGTPSSSKGGTR